MHTHPHPHPAPCVCVRCFSRTLSPFVCARVPSAPCPGGSRAPAAALRCRWGPDRGKGLFLHQPPCPYTLHVEHKQFLHKHTLYLLTFQPHVTLNQHLHLLWSLASRFGQKYLLNEFNRIYELYTFTWLYKSRNKSKVNEWREAICVGNEHTLSCFLCVYFYPRILKLMCVF